VRTVDLDRGVIFKLGNAGEQPRYRFAIEGTAEILERGGVAYAFTPLDLGADIEMCRRLGSLLGSTVSLAAVRMSGTIRVEFSTGTAIVVSPGEWESWQLSTPAVVVHGLPSGGGITWYDAYCGSRSALGSDRLLRWSIPSGCNSSSAWQRFGDGGTSTDVRSAGQRCR
jgi:Family of unknown function (DUF6188)